MIAGLKPYPEYKESGLEWLGRVPRHWAVVRNGSLFGQRNQTGYVDLPILEVSLKTGVSVRDFANSTRKQVMSEVGKYKRAMRGDLAYNMMRMWQGAVGISPVDGLVSPAYVVARPHRHAQSQFFAYLFRTDAYMAEVNNYSHGIVKDRNRLYWDQFKQMLSPCPLPQEQAAIVRFLGWANGRLERAIRAKRKIIALVNEQKQAIIHRAVTRGLDPSVPLKPSGIPWLGDVPAHWEVRRIKSLSPVKRGASPRPIADMRFFDDYGEYAWVRIKDVTASSRYLETTTERLSELGKARSVTLEPGVIFLSIAGSVGKPIISKIKCCIHDGFVHFPQFRGNPEFLHYVLSSVRIYEGLGKLGTQLNLNTETVGSIRIPWPPITEQQQIVDFLDNDLGEFEVSISRLERQIDLLREYRTRLTADVVTGKLDVREAASRLPDEPEPDIEEESTDLNDDAELPDEETAE